MSTRYRVKLHSVGESSLQKCNATPCFVSVRDSLPFILLLGSGGTTLHCGIWDGSWYSISQKPRPSCTECLSPRYCRLAGAPLELGQDSVKMIYERSCAPLRHTPLEYIANCSVQPFLGRTPEPTQNLTKHCHRFFGADQARVDPPEAGYIACGIAKREPRHRLRPRQVGVSQHSSVFPYAFGSRVAEHAFVHLGSCRRSQSGARDGIKWCLIKSSCLACS